MKGISLRRRMHFLFLLLLLPAKLWASAEWSIIIDMTVIQPPCTVNENKLVVVGFEQVTTSLIDGQEYQKKPIKLDIACPGKSSADLKVQVAGDVTSFDAASNYLKTDNDDLGIKILAGSQVLPVNSWLSFAWPQSVPALSAVLVKRKGATLSGGAFNAGATISLAYN